MSGPFTEIRNACSVLAMLNGNGVLTQIELQAGVNHILAQLALIEAERTEAVVLPVMTMAEMVERHRRGLTVIDGGKAS